MTRGTEGPSTKASKALIWGVGGSLGRVSIQLVAQILLARILGPATYGVFVACALAIGLMIYVADSGIAYALVHRPDVTPIDLDFVFTWQLVIGLACAGAVVAAAPLVAGVLGEPLMALPLQALSLVLFLTAAASPAMNMLKRQLDFKSIQLSQLVGYLAGYVLLGVPMALIGMGIWSLVVAWLIQAAVSLLFLWRAHPRQWRFAWRHPDAAGFARFAGVVFVTNVVNWWVNNLDKLLVTRLFSSAAVGLYGTAFNLINTPTAALYSSVQSIVFSTAARMRNDAGGTARSFLVSLSIVLVITLPIAVVLCVFANEVVISLYGKDWAAAGPFLQWFALMVPLTILWGVSTPVLWNADKISREVRLQLVVVFVLAVVLYAAGKVSALAVAQSQFAILLLRTLYVVAMICRRLSIKAGVLWQALWPAAAIGFVWIAAAVSARSLALMWNPPAVFVLLVGCVMAGVAGAVALRLLSLKFHADARMAIQTFCAAMPAKARPIMHWLFRMVAT